MQIRRNFPIRKEKQYYGFMHTINTALSFDSNDKAKLKLRVIELFEKKGYFDKAIEETKEIQHVWSYPKSPKTNGYVERFNWTVQDEFINYEIDVAMYDTKLFDVKLKQWLNYYNTIQPHQSLNYKTPNQQLQLLIN